MLWLGAPAQPSCITPHSHLQYTFTPHVNTSHSHHSHTHYTFTARDTHFTFHIHRPHSHLSFTPIIHTYHSHLLFTAQPALDSPWFRKDHGSGSVREEPTKECHSTHSRTAPALHQHCTSTQHASNRQPPMILGMASPPSTHVSCVCCVPAARVLKSPPHGSTARVLCRPMASRHPMASCHLAVRFPPLTPLIHTSHSHLSFTPLIHSHVHSLWHHQHLTSTPKVCGRLWHG